MFKTINQPIFYLAGLALILFGFQNCSKAQFSPRDTKVTSSVSDQQIDTGIVDDTGVIENDIDVTVEDPDEPVSVELPTLGEYASVAFEDNVLNPNGGDRDYNDAVFNYKVAEKYNSNKELIEIDIEVKVREKISGNNHRLHLYLNGDPTNDFSNISKESAAAFLGLAKITLTSPDGSKEVKNNADHLIIVPETTGAVGNVYLVNIKLNNPEMNQVSMYPEFIDFRKYRLILQNHGQNAGIDIAEINSTDEMLAADGYPLGFMIPTNWDPPQEGQLIDQAYQKFQLYRNWLSGDQANFPSENVLNWFL